MKQASSGAAGVSALLSPAMLSELRRIELRSRRAIDSTLAGVYRSAFRGSGLVFSDLREYQPGDDVKHIHWKASARTGRVFVKSYDEERLLNIVLAVDISRSTAFGKERSKHRRAIEFAALVTMLAAQNRDAAGLCLFGREVHEFLTPSARRAQIHRIISCLLSPPELSQGTSLAAALRHIRMHQRRAAVVFVVSDYISPPFEEELRFLSRRHDVILCMLADELDYELPRAGIVEFADAESGERIMLDTSRDKLAVWLRAQHERRRLEMRSLAQSCQADFLDLEGNPLSALASLMHRRTARQR